jgi:peptidyl-dipeptidase Dcp
VGAGKTARGGRSLTQSSRHRALQAAFTCTVIENVGLALLTQKKCGRRAINLDDAEDETVLRIERDDRARCLTARANLFGLKFEEKQGIPMYHPDVRTPLKCRNDGRCVGWDLSCRDNYRALNQERRRVDERVSPGKRSMDEGDSDVIPIIANHNNFAKAPAGEPTLLSLDDVRTLFHEFGHGLHGLSFERHLRATVGHECVARLRRAAVATLRALGARTGGACDKHARHYKTGDAMPQSLRERIEAARLFNKGFETVQYTSSALVDMAAHALATYDGFDLVAFERDRTRAPRHAARDPDDAPPHALPAPVFGRRLRRRVLRLHVGRSPRRRRVRRVSSKRATPSTRETADRLKRYVYSAGNTIEPKDGYAAFRGRAASVEPMLKKPGVGGGGGVGCRFTAPKLIRGKVERGNALRAQAHEVR